jgi:ELWxxDGT repeat protein
MVRNIRAGAGSYPTGLVNVNGTLFFNATDGTLGQELWKSDGTTAGTVLVKDIRPGNASSTPVGLFNVNGTLYFMADDGTRGRELWKSNGTNAGTVLVKDIRSGSASSNTFATYSAQASFNGNLYFVANDGVTGYEVWKSDGTAAGTVLVADVNPGSATSRPRELMVANGKLFFAALDGPDASFSQELWRIDAASGAVVVKDIMPGRAGSDPRELTLFNGALGFLISKTHSA